jgi:hypothetical protein
MSPPRMPAGCKINNVWIVYTPWSNLKKTTGMEVGQVCTPEGGRSSVQHHYPHNNRLGTWPGGCALA